MLQNCSNNGDHCTFSATNYLGLGERESQINCDQWQTQMCSKGGVSNEDGPFSRLKRSGAVRQVPSPKSDTGKGGGREMRFSFLGGKGG